MVFAIHQHELTTGISPTLYPFAPPSPAIPYRLSQSTSFGCPDSFIVLALVIYFTYGNIHVKWCSLKSSHPRLLPLSPKVCSLHLCLLCCPACRIIGTIFLNFIYNICFNIQYLSFAFWLTSFYITVSSLLHLITTDSNGFLFIAD